MCLNLLEKTNGTTPITTYEYGITSIPRVEYKMSNRISIPGCSKL